MSEVSKEYKSFFDAPDVEYNTDFERPQYLRVSPESPKTVRILDDGPEHLEKHWINSQNISILCLGERCPICTNNQKLWDEFGRGAKGVIPVQNRFVVNVLDRTMVKVDPETGDEYAKVGGEFPSVTKDGERSLVEVEPTISNKVKLLEKGKRLFDQLEAVHKEMFYENGPVTGYDVKILVAGKGLDTTYNVIPLLNRTDDVSELVEEQGKYVLSTQGIELEPREVEELLRGVSLSDIFSARSAEEEALENPEQVADAEESVGALFGN